MNLSLYILFLKKINISLIWKCYISLLGVADFLLNWFYLDLALWKVNNILSINCDSRFPANFDYWYSFTISFWLMQGHMCLKYSTLLKTIGIEQEPWSSGYGRRLMFPRSGVQIPALYTGWTFSHIFIVKIALMFEKTENKW